MLNEQYNQNIKVNYFILALCLLFGGLFSGCVFADSGNLTSRKLSTPAALQSRSIAETKNKLKQIDQQITQLKQTLSHSQDKRGVLTQELANTERDISLCVQKLNTTQFNIKQKQQNITRLQQRVSLLNNQLSQQQGSLAQHVKARYKMGEYRPAIIALNQNDPAKVNQLLTYYQYLVRSRQALIDTIVDTQQNLAVEQQTLQAELTSQEDLRRQVNDQQQNLQQKKHYNQVIIQSLSEAIQNQQHTLSEFEQNKTNLSHLLDTLAQESLVQQQVQPKQPFSFMRHKLPFPVNVKRPLVHNMNQGVTFLADEGTAVHAVYPGRVVFSDWLNGYGLLLIIDHGQGFMTLYAHNQSLFKAKGAAVKQGEQIATIGHSGGIKQNGLYFEVRQKGKAVSPLAWLSNVHVVS
jgi:septal ring factor EnvC (AmiA/AmiB activator)